MRDCSEDAAFLSKDLGCDAVTFEGTATSNTMSTVLYRQGAAIETIGVEPGAGVTTFHSSLRKKPAREVDERKFMDGLFREWGIYIPPALMVRVLLRAGADPNRESAPKSTALVSAVVVKAEDIVDALLEAVQIPTFTRR